MTDGEVCGEFLRDQRSGVPTVLVYLPRVVELQQAIRGGLGRTDQSRRWPPSRSAISSASSSRTKWATRWGCPTAAQV